MNRSGQLHEDLARPAHIRGSSDRNFGAVFTVLFLLIAIWPLRHGLPARIWALPAAAAFLVAAIVFPAALHPLNRAWTAFGLLLGRLVNPVVTAILYFGAVTPVGWLARRCGHDAMRRSFDPAARSYWIPRDPPGPAPDTMTRQF